MSEPQVKETSVSATVGGKLAIIKFDQNSDWRFSISRTYSISEDWDEDQVTEFEQETIAELQKVLDVLDQAAYDERFDQSYLKDK